MSDFLRSRGSRRSQGYRAEHITRRPRPRRRRQRDLARQPRARGSARSQDPLLLAARGDPRPLPVGRALGRHRRHARQDDDDVADRLAADARRRRSERAHRRHRRELRRAATASAAAASSSSKATSTTARSSTRPRSSSSTCPTSPSSTTSSSTTPTSIRTSTPIRLAFRRFVNLVPRRGLLLLGADNAEALALARRTRAAASRRSACRDGADWQAHDLKVARRLDDVQRAPRRRRRSARFEVPLLGAYNVRNALAAIAVGAAVGLSTDTMAAGLRAVQGRPPPACSFAARRAASRSTTTSRTIRPRSPRRSTGVRSAYPGPPHLGDLRAALGDLVPAHLPGGLRAGARRRPIA